MSAYTTTALHLGEVPRVELSQFLSSCIPEPLPSNRRAPQGAATLLETSKGYSNSGIAVESSVAGRAKPIRELDDIDALVRAHRPRLLRFITSSTGDPDLAETIAQDTLLRAYNGREKFRGECSVSTWLTGIAINVLRDYQRTQKYKFWKKINNTAVDVHEMAAFIPAQGSGAEEQLLAKEKLGRLARVLETLSRNQRTVFLMRFSEEMQVADISEVLGMSEATVRTHLHRALTTVRSRLGAKK